MLKKTVEVIDLLSAKYKIENKEKFTNEIFDIVAEVYSKDLKLVDGAKDLLVNLKEIISLDLIVIRIEFWMD